MAVRQKKSDGFEDEERQVLYCFKCLKAYRTCSEMHWGACMLSLVYVFLIYVNLSISVGFKKSLLKLAKVPCLS